MANIHHLVDTQPDICSTLKQIGKIAHSNNKEVYVVGGVVRDLFLDRPLNEIDLMVIGAMHLSLIPSKVHFIIQLN